MVISLMELPIDNLSQILSKLPIKNILICRCVCKTLLDLISNPYFAALHSSNATQNLIIQFNKYSINSPVYLIDAGQLDMNPPNLRESRPIFELPKGDEYNDFYIRNACNGLIFFTANHENWGCSLVCNPITSEYISVPEVEGASKSRNKSTTVRICMGYSPRSRKYKVLRLYIIINYQDRAHLRDVRAHIHDVGSSTWRDVECRDIESRALGTYVGSMNTFLNGTEYWLNTNFIGSFDFESEVFGKIDVPPFSESPYGMGIGVIEDCLCLTNTARKLLDIWMMDKCGQWNKKFTYVDVLPKRRLGYGMTTLRPLQKLSSDEILMVSYNCHDLVCYDTKRNKFRVIDLQMGEPSFNVVSFVPRFVSLKDMLSI